MIKEFQRLVQSENLKSKQDWNLQRAISKINYRIHTDAIKANLVPVELSRAKVNFVYADEADLLNLALFGITAKQWRDSNPDTKGNVRDNATLEQLIVLSNLESLNAVLIEHGIPSIERLHQLNRIAIAQMTSLLTNAGIRKLNADSLIAMELRPEYNVAS